MMFTHKCFYCYKNISINTDVVDKVFCSEQCLKNSIEETKIEVVK